MIKLRGSFQKTPEIIRKAIAFVRVSGASRITASSVSCLSEQCKHPQTVMSGCPAQIGTQRRRTITRLQIRHRYGSRTVMAGLLWWPQRSTCRAFDDGAVTWLTWESRNLTAISPATKTSGGGPLGGGWPTCGYLQIETGAARWQKKARRAARCRAAGFE